MGRIENAVQELLDAAGYGIPVDVEAIARHQGLTIVRQPLEASVSGMLVVKGAGGIIGVNQEHHPNRQRFTIAHEIGHFVLHRHQTSVFVEDSPILFRNESSSDGSKAVEKEANIFAAQLLIPTDALMRYIRQDGQFDPSDDIVLRRLASHFGVSTQPILIRLTRLELI